MGTTIAIFVFSTHINEGVSQTWPKKSKKHESARLVDVCYFKFYGNLTLKTVSKKTPFLLFDLLLKYWKCSDLNEAIIWFLKLMKQVIYELHVYTLRYTIKYDIMKLKLRSLIYIFVCKISRRTRRMNWATSLTSSFHSNGQISYGYNVRDLTRNIDNGHPLNFSIKCIDYCSVSL